jgi:hypothetical protein
MFHSFRWFNNRDSAAQVPPPPPLPPGAKKDFDWTHAIITQNAEIPPTVSLLGALAPLATAASASAAGGGGATASVSVGMGARKSGAGSGALSTASIYARGSLLRARDRLPIEGTPEARISSYAAITASMAAADDKSAEDSRSAVAGNSGKRVLPSTMAPAALPPAITLAPVPTDPTMQVDRGRAAERPAPLTSAPPPNLETFTNVVNSAEETKARTSNAWCWWPF